MTVKVNSKKEEIQYWKKWQKYKDPVAGDYLVKKYLPLVEYCVQRFLVATPKSVDKNELTSLAYEGLLDALNKFNIEKEVKFETYATIRISGAIRDGLRKMDWLPRSVRDKAKKIEQAYATLEQERGNAVTDEEVCEFLGITMEELNKTVGQAALASMISIDETTYDDNQDSISGYNIIADEQIETPEKYMREKFMKEQLALAIDRLPEKEKLVITLIYFEELKLKEIAEVLDVSVSRVSQLHSKAILRLNAALLAFQDTSVVG